MDKQKKQKQKLITRLTRLQLTGFFIGCLVFGLLYYIGNHMLDQYFTKSDSIYIYADYKANLHMIYWFLSVVISILIWILVFVYGIKKEVLYIEHLHSAVTAIENESSDVHIMIRGNDELSVLASSIDTMYHSLLEKNEIEKKLKENQNRLLVSMAHDLRTPLTSLMTFLEIAQKQDTKEACIPYIDKGYAKALQIRDLSNQLFDYFLIHSETKFKLEPPMELETALSEYLSQFCAFLDADGYAVDISEINWKPVRIEICSNYLGRIIDNLISNIRKYANKAQPVRLSLYDKGDQIFLSFENQIKKTHEITDGTGIGIENITDMMEQMHGQCVVSASGNVFCVTLIFEIYHKISS